MQDSAKDWIDSGSMAPEKLSFFFKEESYLFMENYK